MVSALEFSTPIQGTFYLSSSVKHLFGQWLICENNIILTVFVNGIDCVSSSFIYVQLDKVSRCDLISVTVQRKL